MLSATSDGGDSEGTEAEVLKVMGFKVFKNQIFKEDRGDQEIFWEQVELGSHEELLAFVEDELEKRAVILYCTSDFIEDLDSRPGEYLYVDMNLSQDEMRRLDEKRKGRYRLIVSDDASLLSRGIDFRGHKNGLTFIQAKPAPDSRTLTQLGYRVGRLGEPARRIRAMGIDAVDAASEIGYRKKLHFFLSSMEAKAVERVHGSKAAF